MKKQKYRNQLEFIEDAFNACWANANDLINASNATILSPNKNENINIIHV